MNVSNYLLLGFFSFLSFQARYIHGYVVSRLSSKRLSMLRNGNGHEKYNDNVGVVLTGSQGTLGQALVANVPDDIKLYQYVSGRQSSTDFILHQPEWYRNLNQLVVPDIDFEIGNIKHIALLNNAAVCLKGKSQRVLENSICVNALSPAILTEQIITKYHSKVNRITIINISSGDGELIRLDPDIASLIKNTKTIEDLTALGKFLQETFTLEKEYAVGETPFYSISKAMLNQVTRIQSQEYSNNNNNNNINCQIRVLAICPGSFLSRMTTSEDVDVCSTGPIKAVQSIWNALFDDIRYVSGTFYRFGEEISW